MQKKLGLPVNEKVIMFSAENISLKNPWKGGEHLLKILLKMNERSGGKINLLMIGAGNLKQLSDFQNLKVFKKGYITDEMEMCDALNAADTFIYPTKADNLPNILVEAIACGTPCVTFNIGGNREIIINEKNGYIVEPFDFDDFANKTLGLLNDDQRLNEFSTEALREAQRKFNLKEMANEYYTLFSNIKPPPHVPRY